LLSSLNTWMLSRKFEMKDLQIRNLVADHQTLNYLPAKRWKIAFKDNHNKLRKKYLGSFP